jgi:YggT family protein
MRTVFCYLLTVYWVILIVRILSSWFRPPLEGPLRTVWRLLYDVTDPVLRPLRNLLPAVRMGSMAIDFSPIIVFVIIGVLQRVVCR